MWFLFSTENNFLSQNMFRHALTHIYKRHFLFYVARIWWSIRVLSRFPSCHIEYRTWSLYNDIIFRNVPLSIRFIFKNERILSLFHFILSCWALFTLLFFHRIVFGFGSYTALGNLSKGMKWIFIIVYIKLSCIFGCHSLSLLLLWVIFYFTFSLSVGWK